MADIADVLSRHLDDARSSFSVGSYGAIAEFHRAADEPAHRPSAGDLIIVTARGALSIELADDVVPLAYETLSRPRGRWHHGIAFCRPRKAAARHHREVVTELGRDHGAVRDQDREAILFDIGLGARNVDFCVRTSAPDLIGTLRRAKGTSIFAPDSAVMAAVLSANPHRVVVSAMGRAEVYQPIGRETTPEGPHTHVLPRLLRSGRTHSANVPVPAGMMPCLNLYPPSPIGDAMGNAHGYEPETAEAFDILLRCWGPHDFVAEKDRVVEAVQSSARPDDYARATSRLTRMATRIALRQLACRRPGDGDIEAWIDIQDRPSKR